MKLSLEWLGQYVAIKGLKPEDIAHMLTMATAEVEGVEKLRRAVKGIVVGEVIDIEHLSISGTEKDMLYVTVNCGSTVFRTVCGAPNVAIGMKSAFAIPGVDIAAGRVEEQKVYNRISQGILCSPKELGWGESHYGILTFPQTIEVGTDLAEFVPEIDHIIEIDNKSITHRPDLWGHYGFAREVAALYKRELKQLDTSDASPWKSLDEYNIRIEDFDGCPGYSCLDIDGLQPVYSPLDIQYRLCAIGLRPINLIVDLTNYIMYELGQPMHAFDGERVRDISVAPYGSRGTFRTLDGIERDMIPEDLMICDHGGPIALAGIMGGEETEIKENTSRVVLESANFNPARIRRTSVRLGLRSDASLRFEKGQPLYHMGLSIERFVRLLEICGQKPEIKSRLTARGETGETPRTMTMESQDIVKKIGMNIPDEQIQNILQSLGFSCRLSNGELIITIPFHRSVRDISIPNDIVEEVARIYGYGNITPSMPQIEMRPYTFNTELMKQHTIQRFLSLSKGFTEVHTYSWYDDVWLKRIGYNPEETLKLQNPAVDTNTRIRRDLIPNLLALVESNIVHRDRFFLYEMGNVHHPSENGVEQNMHLGVVCYQSVKLGRFRDLFLFGKGVVEDIFTIVNSGNPVFSQANAQSKPWCNQETTMDISVDGVCIGQIGFLVGPVLENFEKDTQVVWFELIVNKLVGFRSPVVTYEPLPVYPGSWMDFSILTDKVSPFTVLEKLLDTFTHPIITKRKYLYSYDGKGLPDGKISYTFRYWLGLKERTLNSDDINEFRQAFLAFLEHHELMLR